MLTAGQPVQTQVALRPLQIGARHVDRGGAARAAQPGVHAGAAGIGEEVEEIFILAHFAEHLARDAVVEEQPGVQVVRQVHQQARVILMYFEEIALLAQFLILILAFLPLARFQHQTVGGQLQYAERRTDNVKQALARFRGVDGLGRRVLLHHHPLAVAIHRYVVFRQIGVIEAIAGDTFLTCPLL